MMSLIFISISFISLGTVSPLPLGHLSNGLSSKLKKKKKKKKEEGINYDKIYLNKYLMTHQL